MRRWVLFLPFLGLVFLAAWLGWKLGRPMSETEIINFYADRYVSEMGGVATECVARPSGVEGARMEITCRKAEEGILFIVGPRGGLIAERALQGPDA